MKAVFCTKKAYVFFMLIPLIMLLKKPEIFPKAENYAVTLYDEYTNIYGQKVTYKLLDTVESFLMHEEISFEDGAEIFSSIFESEDLFKLRYTRCSVEDMYIIRRL